MEYRVTREEAIRSLRQKKAYEKKLADQEKEGMLLACCAMIAGYLLMMAMSI